jgi:hypothetical protein
VPVPYHKDMGRKTDPATHNKADHESGYVPRSREISDFLSQEARNRLRWARGEINLWTRYDRQSAQVKKKTYTVVCSTEHGRSFLASLHPRGQ